MSLIQIDDGFVLNSESILVATRNGNYTEIAYRRPFSDVPDFRTVWDEDKRVWNSINEAVEEKA